MMLSKDILKTKNRKAQNFFFFGWGAKYLLMAALHSSNLNANRCRMLEIG